MVVQIPQQDDRPSSLTWFCDIKVWYGTYWILVPFTETSRGEFPLFQTPHLDGSLNQEAEEDMKIVKLF